MNIIELAKEAGIMESQMWSIKGLGRFAALVRAEAYKNWNPDVTFNEDGTFSLELPDGDELRIIPPKREWVDLTDDEIFSLGKEKKFPDTDPVYFSRAVIAAFKEKQK